MTGSHDAIETARETESTDPSESAFRLSVVIAWVNDFKWLEPCLEALANQQGPGCHEVIIATRRAKSECDRLAERFGNVCVVAGAPNDSIPVLRSKALERVSGNVVAVTEDHCVADPGWTAAIARVTGGGAKVVGGPVENAYDDRLCDEAAFLTEYAGAIGPAKDGPVEGLPGNNVAYTRDLVDGLRETLANGRWESFYHDALRARGVTLVYDSAMIMRHRRSFDFGYFCGQRFHFCRSFAQMRNVGMSMGKRVIYGAASILLPPMLWWRSFSMLRKKKRFVGRFLTLTPLIGVYLVAGAIGEMCGYLLGGGRSLERVE